MKAALVAGVGLAATVDQILFHELLHWHELYSRGSAGAGRASDGVLHVAGATLLIAGVWGLRDVRFRNAWPWILVAAGTFNLLDEIVFHKLLDWHQVREGAAQLPYDLGYSLGSLALVVIGLLARPRPTIPPSHASPLFRTSSKS